MARTVIGRLALLAALAALLLALPVDASAAPAGPGSAVTAKKKRKRCRAGFRRVTVRVHGRRVRRCRRRRRPKGVVRPTPPQAAPPKPTVLPGPNDTEAFLASRGGIWYEDDWDSDGVCAMYQFVIGSLGEKRGARKLYFANPFTGACQIGIGGQTSPATFVYSVQGNTLNVQFVSGFLEQITLDGFDPNEPAVLLHRPGDPQVWWVGCGSASMPGLIAVGCP